MQNAPIEINELQDLCYPLLDREWVREWCTTGNNYMYVRSVMSEMTRWGTNNPWCASASISVVVAWLFVHSISVLGIDILRREIDAMNMSHSEVMKLQLKMISEYVERNKGLWIG